MMELGIAHSLSRTFRRGTDEEAYRLLLWQHRERQERERREKQEQFDEGEADLIDLATTIITTEQAELFQEELDIYQTATIEALDENRRAIELARERLDDILAQAHVLKDGRRVFKTEDGTRVFDECGVELGPETISPDDIRDHLTRWETAKGAMDELERLEGEQKELLDFQAELDEAQELLDSGKMTEAEFEERRDYLREHTPDAVKAHAHGIDFGDNPRSSPGQDIAAEIDLDDELSGMALPTPTVPSLGQ